MRHCLTLNVFRGLLSTDGIVFRCPHRPRHILRRQYELRSVFRVPKRTLFGFSQKPPREIRQTDLDPGLRIMLDLADMNMLRARPPPKDELIKAFKDYFAYKSRVGEAVNNIQAQHALNTFRHIQYSEDEGTSLSIEDLEEAREVLMKMPQDKTHTHNEFARELFAELTRRKKLDKLKDVVAIGDVRRLATVLTCTGDSMEARKYVEEYSNLLRRDDTKRLRQTVQKLWTSVLKGFASEDNEEELLKTVNLAEAAGIPYIPAFQEVLSIFYASKNDIKAVKSWYSKAIYRGGGAKAKPNVKTLSEMLRFCIRNDEVEWCNKIFRALLDDSPDKPTWDIIFQWAAGLGKGVEHIEHMIEVMKRRNADNPSIQPDAETINGLVDLAISRNDPYLAERYLTLGQKLGIRPNARSFILQMNYRIDAGDLPGAQAAHDALQGQEILDREDLPVINKYIQALCSSKSPNYDRIMAIVADLEEMKTHLEADTISALCLMHLMRDEVHEVLDILQAHSFHHTEDERARTRGTLFAFCMNHKNDTGRVWNAYTVLQHMYDETDVEMRTQLMNQFFERKRCDMAFHVFGHMRQQSQEDKRPTIDTYVQCFEGIAKCADIEHLEMVHNMMKMDSYIDPSTKLYNALMLAYTMCDDPYKALEFWADITNSREGPTYSSIQIVFRVCEMKPFGDKPAKEIWNKMRRMEIEVTPAVFSAYVGALAGQALLDEVKALIDGMEPDLGFGPDTIT
jgi:hypothetical protein